MEAYGSGLLGRVTGPEVYFTDGNLEVEARGRGMRASAPSS